MQGKRPFWSRLVGGVAAATLLISLLASPMPALAGTTGILEGTISDAASGKPIADATVVAISPSGSFKAATDAHGFYAIMDMLPDTYTVRIDANGYAEVSVPGVFVSQDDIVRFDRKLSVEALRTIGRVEARSRSSLLQPYQGSDVYNVSGDQLNAATGGTDTHETEYQYIDTVPGVVGSGGYAIGQPSIHGGFSDVDTGFELDGVPISDRQTGFFGTNLTNIGVNSVDVVTGGLTADEAQNGTGLINQVSKVGTYPGYFWISSGVTDDQFGHYERAELSGATKNGKFSWFLSNDAANNQNYYWVGSQTLNSANYPLLTYPGYITFASAGYIWTRDVLANFHWRPDPRDDIQVMNLNSFFYDQGNWDLGTSASDPAIGQLPCKGAVGNQPTASNGAGGYAPNGQYCPLGLYNYYLPSGTGNFAGHNSDVWKVQWNHEIGAKSSFELHVAEFYNRYDFNQPYSDPNSPTENVSSGGTFSGASCPQFPVANGSPLQGNGGTGYFDECTLGLGADYELRDDKDYFIAGDYTWTPNANVTIKGGAGDEYDDQIQYTEYLNLFNVTGTPTQIANTNFGICRGGNASWPCVNQWSDNPAHTPYVYGEATVNLGRFTVEPGLRWSRDFYGIPAADGGAVSAGFFAPSVVGTYRANADNVFRYSYATTASYTGSIYVYELNNTTFDPATAGPAEYQPALNHTMDLQWEHQFNPETTLRFGPYWRATDNYPAFYTPFIGFEPGTNTWIPTTPQLVDNLHIRQLGAELGVSHNDPRPTGVGWWLSGSYCNCWTQVDSFNGGHGSYFNEPLPSYFTNQGIYIRNTSTPLFAAVLTADAHTNGWHVIPYVYWTFDNFYNSGGCLQLNAAGTGYVPSGQNDVPTLCQQQTSAKTNRTFQPALAPEGIGMGYWYANLTIAKDINKTWRVGIFDENMFNMQHGPVPACFSVPGYGCYPGGPQSGTIGPANQWDYQNFVNGNPRIIEVFARAYIGNLGGH